MISFSQLESITSEEFVNEISKVLESDKELKTKIFENQKVIVVFAIDKQSNNICLFNKGTKEFSLIQLNDEIIHSLIRFKPELIPELVGQAEVGVILDEITEQNWDRRKVSVYQQREILPSPITYTKINKTPLWEIKEIEEFGLKNRMGLKRGRRKK
ncbi:MAG: hypothetical protein ACH0QD_05410 [Tepidibacillus sp.]